MARSPIHRVHTVDYHTAGEPFRIVTGGVPALQGRTLLDQRRYATHELDGVRRLLVHEPRGHADMYGCFLAQPEDGADLAAVFFHSHGFSTACGHGTIALVTWALESGHLPPRTGERREVSVDVPSGRLSAIATLEAGDVTSVRFRNVPAFVVARGVPTEGTEVDVAFGGAFYAIVDSESVGLPIDAAHLPELRRIGMAIKEAIEATQTIAHPLEPGLTGIYGTIFTAPPADDRADLRNVTVFADAEVDRSPCGTGTCAVMAVIDAMGLLDEARPFVHESLIGTRFKGRVASRTLVGDYEALVPEIEGSAWITGEHTFLIDENDPLKEGFRL
jgi:proline racemase